MKLKRTLLATLLAVASATALAEEGGTGHYMPGSMASFIDSVPPAAPAFLMRLNVINYDAKVDKNVQLPFAGMVLNGAEVEVEGYGLTMVWSPDVGLPSPWNFAMSATIPVVNVNVNASASAATRSGASKSISLSDSELGLGDLVLQPIMLNYKNSPDLSTNFRLSVYAPTGDYTVGKLANTGKNYWSFEPTLAFVYFGQQNGIEATLFNGITFNTENKDTQYHSGAQYHVEGTLAQHFPLWGGLAGAGLTGYYYHQLVGDSGAGATMGDFKAGSAAIGPALSYITKVGNHNVSAELKWLRDFDNVNRLKGDTIFFKLLSNF